MSLSEMEEKALLASTKFAKTVPPEIADLDRRSIAAKAIRARTQLLEKAFSKETESKYTEPKLAAK